MNNDVKVLKGLVPMLVLSSAVIFGFAAFGNWWVERKGSVEAGPSINKRKNFLDFQRENYGYPYPS